MKNKSLILIKAMLIHSLRLNNFTKKANDNQKKAILFAVIIFVAITSILFSLGSYYWLLGRTLNDIGQIDVLLSTAATAPMLVCLLMSIYKSAGYLYSFKDFDMLASLPIRTGDILTSKIFMLYISNMGFCLCISLPAIFVYGNFASVNALYYIYAVLLLILCPAIPTVVGALISLPMAKISTKFKKSNILISVFAFAVTIFIIVLTYVLPTIGSDALGNAFVSVDNIIMYYYPAKLFVRALSNGTQILPLIIFALINIGVFAIFVAVFASFFISVNSSLNEKHSQSNYKLRSLSVSKPIIALYKRELKCYISIPVYLINTSIGVVMMTVYVVAIIIFDYETVAAMLAIPAVSELAVPLTSVIVCSCIALTCTTSPSISIEGDKFWIIRTIPVQFRDVILSKILVNLTITVPFLFINSILMAIAFNFTLLDFVLFLLPSLGYCILVPLVGIIMNLYYPKLEWKTPTHAVKQSASVMLAMLINAVAVAIPVAIYYFSKPTSYAFFVTCVSLALLLISYALWLYIKTAGERIYNALLN